LSGLGYQPLSAAGTWIAHLQPRGATAPYWRSIAGPSGAAPAGIVANPRFRGTGLAQTTCPRLDVLDTSLSLRRPSDYTPAQGARFEVHIEKGRSLHGEDAKPFEARLDIRERKTAWSNGNMDVQPPPPTVKDARHHCGRDRTAWLPFLNTYRTMCLAPEPPFRRILEEIRMWD
jgi:hypothetical protein